MSFSAWIDVVGPKGKVLTKRVPATFDATANVADVILGPAADVDGMVVALRGRAHSAAVYLGETDTTPWRTIPLTTTYRVHPGDVLAVKVGALGITVQELCP